MRVFLLWGTATSAFWAAGIIALEPLFNPKLLIFFPREQTLLCRFTSKQLELSKLPSLTPSQTTVNQTKSCWHHCQTRKKKRDPIIFAFFDHRPSAKTACLRRVKFSGCRKNRKISGIPSSFRSGSTRKVHFTQPGWS